MERRTASSRSSGHRNHKPLIDRLPGAKGPHPNRVPSEIEQAVLDHALADPCHGALRVEQELRLRGLQVSSGGIRGHDARTAGLILLKAMEETGFDPSEWIKRCDSSIGPGSGANVRREGDGDGPLVGESIVFTGALQVARRDAADMAHEAGAAVELNVTKSTDRGERGRVRQHQLFLERG